MSTLESFHSFKWKWIQLFKTVCSLFSLKRKKNRSFLNSTEIGWPSTFCEESTFSCLTIAELVWFDCHDSVWQNYSWRWLFVFFWFSCSSFWVKQRFIISAKKNDVSEFWFFAFVQCTILKKRSFCWRNG